MSLQIIKQASLTGTSCLGYSNSSKNEHFVWRPEDDAPFTDAQHLSYLNNLGFRAWSTRNPLAELHSALEQVQDVTGYRIADRPGDWNGGSFALPTGEVFCPAGVTPASIAFKPRRQARAPRASLRRWKRTVAVAVLEQPVLLTCLAVAFAALLRSIVGQTQPTVIQLCGPSSSHVSVAGKLIASLFEPPEGNAGIYFTTCRALHEHSTARVYGGLATVISEISLHMARLSSGQRANAAVDIIEAMRSAGAVVMIDRVPVAATIPDSPEIVAELDERVTTILIASDREHGVFDSVPEGVASSTDFARYLSAAAARSCGQAGRH
ncbi:DUF927 domain-containing protein [Sphingomonas sp. 1P08PE]|uniref:DUF927 domain-containing protein n=1 Tax=Sphingomonas sp. 1P08PE TaxID=554122 RepID=UPI00399F3B2E